MPNYQRPDLPYENVPQPNDNRFAILTEEGRSPTAKLMEAELNARVDADNDLQRQIDNIAAGIIPGSDNPLNENKLVTTDGNNNVSYTFVDGINMVSGAVGTGELNDGAVTTTKLGDASVIEQKIANLSVSTRTLQDGSVTRQKLGLNSVTFDKVADGQIITSKLTDAAVTTAKLANAAVINDKVTDGTLTGAKMVAETVTNRELSRLCTWKPGDLKMSVAEAASPGFLNCNGGLFNRVTYAALFAAIGIKFGAGDGNTTFAVPDFRGRAPVGFDYTQAGLIGATGSNITNVGNDPNGHAPYTIAYQGGEQTHTLTINEIPAHTHSYQQRTDFDTIDYPGGRTGKQDFNGTTGSTGGGAAHNNLQPYGYSIMWIYAGV